MVPQSKAGDAGVQGGDREGAEEKTLRYRFSFIPHDHRIGQALPCKKERRRPGIHGSQNGGLYPCLPAEAFQDFFGALAHRQRMAGKGGKVQRFLLSQKGIPRRPQNRQGRRPLGQDPEQAWVRQGRIGDADFRDTPAHFVDEGHMVRFPKPEGEVRVFFVEGTNHIFYELRRQGRGQGNTECPFETFREGLDFRAGETVECLV